MAQQTVGHLAGAQHPNRAKDIGDGDNPAGERHSQPALMLKIARQPSQVEPHHVDDAHEAQDDAPGALIAEQASPLFGSHTLVGRHLLQTFVEMPSLFMAQLDVRAIPEDEVPPDGNDDPEHAGDDEHPTVRATRNWDRLLTSPQTTWASDQKNMPTPSIIRAPNRSSIAPIGS